MPIVEIPHTQMLMANIQFLTGDVHNRPVDFIVESSASPVIYQLPNARNRSVLKVLDYRKTARIAWRKFSEDRRVSPEIIRAYLNVPASVLFFYEERTHETPDGSIAIPVYGFLKHIELNEIGDRKPSCVLTHVGHGKWITGGEALKISPNFSGPISMATREQQTHSAITVIASQEVPAVIEQVPCQGRVFPPPILFINDKVWEVEAKQLPSEGVQRTAIIQNFVENGVVPGQ